MYFPQSIDFGVNNGIEQVAFYLGSHHHCCFWDFFQATNDIL